MSSLVPSLSIVDIGRYLQQKHGLNIGEHPAFGGVGAGHSPTGYHPAGMAIDVRDWRPDVAPAYKGGQPKHWKQRTGELSWRAKQLGLFSEALGPGDKGHDTHVHLALEGTRPITNQQLEWLATGRYKNQEGKLTDVMPGSVPSAPQLPPPDATIGGAQSSLDSKQVVNAALKDALMGSLLQQALLKRNEGMSQSNPYAQAFLSQEMIDQFS